MKKYCFAAAVILVLGACHHTADSKAAAVKNDSAAAPEAVVGVLPGLKDLSFAFAKDPACGMPLKMGLTDTTTYKGKLYGFCSRECKDEFLKNPAGYVAKIK
jgi:YHS domain-containing protein